MVCGGGGGGGGGDGVGVGVGVGDGVGVGVGGGGGGWLNTQRCWNGNTKELVSYELWRETHFTDMV